MDEQRYALVITGREDPMWPFLLEACTEEERHNILLFATEDPRRVRCTYDPIERRALFTIDGKYIDGCTVRSVWWRRIAPLPLEHLGAELQEYCEQEHLRFLEGLEWMLPHAL